MSLQMWDREAIEVFSKCAADQVQQGHRLNKYLTWLVAFKVHMASRAFCKGPPANVKELLIMVGATNVDGLSNSLLPKPKRKKASAIPCRPCKLKKTNVPKDINDDILAIMDDSPDEYLYAYSQRD